MAVRGQSPWIVLVAGIFAFGLFAAGLGAVLMFQAPATRAAGEVASPDKPATSEGFAATVAELERRVVDLQTELEMQSAQFNQRLDEALAELGRRAPSRAAVEPEPEARPREPVDQAELNEIAALNLRVSQLEQQLRELRQTGLAMGVLGGFEIPIPAGMTVRQFMTALKELDSDEVTRAHRFWTPQQVEARYGSPDVIEQRSGYVEWIYRLPNLEDQFDFHFVEDQVVLAH